LRRRNLRFICGSPYAQGSRVCRRRGSKAGWLADGGWFAVETEAKDTVDPSDWQVEAERRVGRARLTLIRS
jgi:16S rRNA (guanine966-N2)-methyltransferase